VTDAFAVTSSSSSAITVPNGSHLRRSDTSSDSKLGGSAPGSLANTPPHTDYFTQHQQQQHQQQQLQQHQQQPQKISPRNSVVRFQTSGVQQSPMAQQSVMVQQPSVVQHPSMQQFMTTVKLRNDPRSGRPLPQTTTTRKEPIAFVANHFRNTQLNKPGDEPEVLEPDKEQYFFELPK
jgi:hypothetical protein